MGSLLAFVRARKDKRPIALFVRTFIARWDYMVDLKAILPKVHFVTRDETDAALTMPQSFLQGLALFWRQFLQRKRHKTPTMFSVKCR
jgi:hypothetical protein